MMWFDFFLQAVVTALAWCLVIALVAGSMIGGICAALLIAGRGPVRRPRR